MSTNVKICGVTTLGDAELALSCGAWAVGLVFYPESPRRCGEEAAVEIAVALRRRAEVVGVFFNAPLDDVVARAGAMPLTIAQLHGEEGPSYCEEVRRRTGLKVIKAMRVRHAAQVRALSAYKTDYHMLDAYVPGLPGGTGQRFDWSLAADHPHAPPLLLSGGITPDNVSEAVEAVRPFGVDVSSGVESSPGRKDPDLVKGLFRAVREAAPAQV